MLFFDIETDGLLPFLTRVHCIVIYDDELGHFSIYDRDHLPIEEGVQRLQDAEAICGHNIIDFDIPALKKLYPWFTPRGLTASFRADGSAGTHDTLVYVRLLFPNIADSDFARFRSGRLPGKLIGSHSLKAWGYRLGVLKGEFGEETDWQSWTPEMTEYCVQDVQVLRAIWKHCQEYIEKDPCDYTSALEVEHKTQHILGRQQRRGFWFDVEAAQRFHIRLVGVRDKLLRWLRTNIAPFYMPDGAKAEFTPKVDNKRYHYKAGAPLTKLRFVEFDPNSSKHIAWVLIHRFGWEPTEFTEKTGEPKTDEDSLKGLPWTEAKVILKYQMVQKRIGQLAEGEQAWLLNYNEETHCIHGQVNTMGAVTYRMTHYKPNMAQIPNGHSPLGKTCRGFFKARPGYVLVGCDAEGLEARGISHFLAFYDGGAYAHAVVNGDKKKGTDVHTMNMKAIEAASRDNAKTWFYAWMYGAGDEKLGKILGKDKAAGGKSKRLFLERIPAFKHLTKAVQNRVRNQKYLKGIDGRKLHVRAAYSALNTLNQSLGGVTMKYALVILDDTLQQTHRLTPGDDYEFVGNIHDEWQIEARPDIAELVGKEAADAIRKAGELLGLRCALAGDYSIGSSWAETH